MRTKTNDRFGVARMSSSPNTASAEFRGALGRFATGVTIVTTRDAAGVDIGLTANSFSSVSLDPPLVLWSLSRNSLNLPVFLNTGHFAVHVLASNQDELSNRFATRGADKFSGLQITRGPGDIPLLADCSARFQCRTTYKYEGGDHVIFVGEVLVFDHTDRAPLVFHGGRYAIAAVKAITGQPTRATGPEAGSHFSDDLLLHQLGRAYHQLFLRLRRDLLQHGLAMPDWYVLTTLANSPGLTLTELDKALAYTGVQVTYDQLAGLAAAGFLEMKGAYDPGVRSRLTPVGRQAVVELVAAAKAAEADAERSLGRDETQLLQQWLSCIIRDSDLGLLPTSPHQVD
jgi:3-hydroxy-9,10-secoandrosta-1,3,5(10)-triene-9,17-dione monooxygenase reductase component